jgi:hypothetical protein
MVLSKVVNTPGMEIEIGKLYNNRTVKYLTPGLNFYGPVLKTKLNLVFKLAFGIHDTLLDGSHLEGQKNIFILVDKLVRPELFQNFMDWVKHQEYYVTDYVYDAVMETHSRKHMIVLAYPPTMGDAYDKFLLGKYSKMYTKKEIAEYFSEDTKTEARQVLCRSINARPAFISLIKSTFGTQLIEQDFLKRGWEYDLPPNKEEEFFNTFKTN